MGIFWETFSTSLWRLIHGLVVAFFFIYNWWLWRVHIKLFPISWYTGGSAAKHNSLSEFWWKPEHAKRKPYLLGFIRWLGGCRTRKNRWFGLSKRRNVSSFREMQGPREVTSLHLMSLIMVLLVFFLLSCGFMGFCNVKCLGMGHKFPSFSVSTWGSSFSEFFRVFIQVGSFLVQKPLETLLIADALLQVNDTRNLRRKISNSP